MFKIRNVQTGQFYPRRGYYRTLTTARKAFRKIMTKNNLGRAELELIEYTIERKE